MELLGQRAIIGTFYHALSVDTGAAWIADVSNYFPVTQMSETYAWLSDVPQMKEWVGGREAKQLFESSFTIRNKHYESTMEFLEVDLMLDKSEQTKIRIAEQAQRANTHWATLISALVAAGAASLCYDGQYFFDTTHAEGTSGTQSNMINADISAFPVVTTGIVTAPSVPEMQFAILEGIKKILGFLDSVGEPMNEDATQFAVMVPLSLWPTALQAVATPVQIAESQSALVAAKKEFSIKVVMNPRLSAWTDTFAVFRTDAKLKSFIQQELRGVELRILGRDSDYAILNQAHIYGIDAWRSAGYGRWQNSCLVTMT